jgi:hypothetical protein
MDFKFSGAVKAALFLLLASSLTASAQQRVNAQQAPDEARFTKSILSVGKFTEPTEMTILPNLDILIVQRRGEILKYSTTTKTLKQVAKLDVYFKELKKAAHPIEDGLLGIQMIRIIKRITMYMFIIARRVRIINRLITYRVLLIKTMCLT